MAKVLIVDDSKFARVQITKNLKENGYEVIEGSNGTEGLQLARSQEPDCIITDLLMPEMDGIGLLENLRKDNIQIPVIVMTSDIQDTTKRKVLELGAAALINKPPEYSILFEKLQMAIEKGDSKT